MTLSKLHGTKTERVLQDIKIGVLVILVILLMLGAILELVRTGSQEIVMTEPLAVSAAPIETSGTRYTVGITGEIANTGDGVMVVDAVRVTVCRGRRSETVELKGFLLPPRSSQRLEEMIECTAAYDSVERVELVTEGRVEVLDNAPVLTGSGPVLLYAVPAIIVLLLLIRAAMVRYYMWQEARM